MSKTYLVAEREFMENMKTKTFWLGIFAAPVMIILFYAGMFLLADQTDVRKFVILDNSKSETHGDQWLSKRVRANSKREYVIETVNDAYDDAIPEGRPLRKIMDELTGKKKLGAWMVELGSSPLSALAEAMKIQSKLKTRIEDITDEQELAELSEDQDALKEAFSGLQSKIESLGVHKDFIEVPAEDLGDDPEQTLRDRLKKDEIFAYFVIGEDPLHKGHGSKYVSENVADAKLKKWFANTATDILRDEHADRLKRDKNLSDSDLANIKSKFNFIDKKIDETGNEQKVEGVDRTRQFAPIAFVYALWMSIFIAAQMLLTNTVEEKSNRVIEVLLSSVSPTQLMNGKIFGIAATGLTIVGSWGIFLIAGVKLAHLFLPANAMTAITKFGLDVIVSDPVFLASFICYFLTGYLFYAALLVAIGSVCNSLKEAQNLQQPVVFLLFVPFATMFPIAQDPHGTLAKVITYIPFYTPFAMMNRAGSPPPLWEYIASSAMILISLWIAFRGAAKVFRVGVLMTGKPPKIREIIKWMRAPTR